MRTRVQKWGNSLALRIPKTFAREAGIVAETPVDLYLADGKVVIAPVPPETILEQLLAQITPENVHAEIDSGTAVGNEVW